MAYIIVYVPSGEYCNTCRFLRKGTVECTMFDELVEETDDKKIKCDRCKECCVEMDNRRTSMEIKGDK